MAAPSRVYKIIVVNLLVLLALNFFFGVLRRVYPPLVGYFSTGKALDDPRWTMPNYELLKRILLMRLPDQTG